MNDRESWLQERRKSIGSSDAAAVLGVSPWSCALDVYASKVHGVSLAMNDALEWGQRLEPAIAGAAIDRHGWTLSRCENVRHVEFGFLSATPDRINQDGEIVEIKTTSRGDGWGDNDTADIPLHYWVQVQHQLAVVGSHRPVELAWVCVLIAGREYRRYRIPRDAEYLDVSLPTLQEFWGLVESQTPPEPDWSDPNTAKAVLNLHRPIAGLEVELDADADALADEYEALGTQIKSLSQDRDIVKAKLVNLLGPAECGLLPDRIVRRRETERAGYTVQPSQYVDFRILKRGKK